ncbi:MAG TPA: type IV pilin N-terminal domain-containing protein [Chitinispirillaceae bacterium]|nr:type IV pilin N-terminal domain-containing protein [Chitinispirillaceae bacterium]
MLGNLRKFFNDLDSVSGVVGEVLLTCIAVIVAGVFSTVVFSLDRPVDSPHVVVEKWARAPTDIIYIRHCGGDVVDTDELKIIASIDGSSYEYSPTNVSSSLNKSIWELGDTIAINASDKWGVSLTKGDPVYLHMVDTDSKQVFRKVKVIPGGGSSGGWIPPAQVYENSAGSSNITDVIKEGDGNHTHYLVLKKNTPGENDTHELFTFGVNMADYDYRLGEPVSNVKLKIVYETHDNSFLYIRLKIFDAYPLGEWYIEESQMNESSSPVVFERDLTSRINTIEDIERLKVKIEAVGNAASAKEVNIDYIAVSFE